MAEVTDPINLVLRIRNDVNVYDELVRIVSTAERIDVRFCIGEPVRSETSRALSTSGSVDG